MATSVLLLDALGAALGIAVATYLYRRLPFMATLYAFQRTLTHALRVVVSRRISDHWKEIVLPRYSLNILIGSLRFTFFLMLILGGFALTFSLAGLPFGVSFEAMSERLLEWQPNLFALAFGIVLMVVLPRLRGNRKPAQSEYGPLDRLLHHMLLGSRAMRQIAFDVGQAITPGKPDEPAQQQPVYVAGLARAGTTIVLEALYSSGAFTSLTYRDMPLVMAPRLWAKLTAGQHKNAELRERAHHDRLKVGFDSPEAFEEVFWLTMTEADYIGDDGLTPRRIDAEVIADYRRYVASVRAASGRRYLAKNNNNLLRLDAIRAAFPEGVILVPFRDPLDHAHSLLRQHRQFIDLHAGDAFALKYMNWLGHHEFGAGFKPILFDSASRPVDAGEALTVAYWLRYWTHVHRHLLDHHLDQIVLFDYDSFCAQPEDSLRRLADAVHIDPAPLLPFAARVHPPARHDRKATPLPPEPLAVHAELRAHALQRTH